MHAHIFAWLRDFYAQYRLGSVSSQVLLPIMSMRVWAKKEICIMDGYFARVLGLLAMIIVNLAGLLSQIRQLWKLFAQASLRYPLS